jgi:hypothetical protein
VFDGLDNHPYAQASLRDRRPFGCLSVRVGASYETGMCSQQVNPLLIAQNLSISPACHRSVHSFKTLLMDGDLRFGRFS